MQPEERPEFEPAEDGRGGTSDIMGIDVPLPGPGMRPPVGETRVGIPDPEAQPVSLPSNHEGREVAIASSNSGGFSSNTNGTADRQSDNQDSQLATEPASPLSVR